MPCCPFTSRFHLLRTVVALPSKSAIEVGKFDIVRSNLAFAPPNGLGKPGGGLRCACEMQGVRTYGEYCVTRYSSFLLPCPRHNLFSTRAEHEDHAACRGVVGCLGGGERRPGRVDETWGWGPIRLRGKERSIIFIYRTSIIYLALTSLLRITSVERRLPSINRDDYGL
jgi:hypothetical protein